MLGYTYYFQLPRTKNQSATSQSQNRTTYAPPVSDTL